MQKIQRNFSCRDEELIQISKFTSYSLKRDLDEISKVFLHINTDYCASTDALIAEVENLVEPETETLAKKQITKAIYESLDALSVQINYLSTYLKLAGKNLNISTAEFGIVKLRKAINNGDTEAVIEHLKIVLKHTITYSATLTNNGMSADFPATLEAILTQLNANRQKQNELLTNRMVIVQDNIAKLNQLHANLTDIYAIGKALYAKTNAVKMADYTFTKLLNRVRQAAKTNKTPETIVNN